MATVPSYAPGTAVTSTALTFWTGARPVAYAASSGSQSIPNAGWVNVTLGTPTVDRDGAFTAGSYALGDTLGAYLVSGQVTFAASTSGTERGARLWLNGGAVPGAIATIPANITLSTAQTVTVPPTLVVATASTDTLVLQGYQDSGSALNATAASLRVEYVGATGVLAAPVGVLQSTSTTSGGAAPIPGVPTFGTFTSTTYQPTNGLAQASTHLTWTAVTLNADSSPDTDLDHYEIQYQQTGSSTGWQSQTVSGSATSTTVIGLNLGTSYDWQIRAVNGSAPATDGAWSATTAFTTSLDVTPPGIPDVPTVAASLIAVQITHDLGLASGGAYSLPPDLDHLEVHLGASSGFTPSGLTLAGTLKANWGMIQANIPAVGTFATSSTSTVWVKVIAVDNSGNRSSPSSAASATTTLIDDSHISSLTASKITAGTITAAVIIGGSATFSGTLSGATGTFSGTLSASTISGSTITGTTISGGTVTGATVQTASSGQRVVLNTAGQIDIIGSLGNTGHLLVNGLGQMLVQAPGTTINLDGAGSTINSSWSVTGYISASSGWSGAFSASSISTSGTLSSTGNFTTYGTTTTINPSGSINMTATGIYGTASSTWQATAGGGSVILGSGTDSITLGASSGNLALGPLNVVLSNIQGTTGTSIALKMISGSRQLQWVSSTRADKIDIQDVPITPADALQMRPVTFYDRTEHEAVNGDTAGLPRYIGMIAEEVDAIPTVGPLLVIRDGHGAPISLAYERIAVAQQVILRDLAARVAALETR